jgi:hypothetical protein
MKHIIQYNKNIDYKIDIFTIKEAGDFYNKFIKNNDYYDYDNGYEKYNLNKKIRYFDYNDIQSYGGTKEYNNTCRLIIAHDNKDILGICKFAYFGSTQSYSISYLSTNNNFFNMGVSKKLLEKMFEYFSKTYPNDILSFSGYSIDGWKYLRKSILEFSKKYNVKITEKWIQYPGLSGKFSEEEYKLMDKSKEEIRQTYGYKKDIWEY